MIPLHVGSPRIIVVREFRDQIVEMPFAKDDELCQAFKFYGLDEPLASAVHLRRQLHRIATMGVELSG